MAQPSYNFGENERIKVILGLEQKYPVHEWSINGIDLWPVIRTYLYVELWVEHERSKKTTSNQPQQHAKSPNVAGGISLQQRIVYLRDYVKFRLTPLKKSRAVFASAPGYIENYKGKTLHRFFDPLRITKPEYRNAYIVFASKQGLEGIEQQIPLGSFDYVQNLFARYYRKKGFSCHLSGFDAFCEELQCYSPIGKRLTIAFLQEAVTSIEKHAFIFKTILKKTHAKEAISLCYYLDSKAFFGMNLAAHRLGITSIDIQHGGQGNHHLAYGQFYKVPASGSYALLPSVFWCWDKASAESIRQWSSMEGVKHHAEVIDHPWLQFLASTTDAPTQLKPVVVYSLQPFQTLILPQVINAMKVLGAEYSWILRLHPNMQSRATELKTLLEDEQVMAFIHPMTFDPLSLPETLAIASIHLTRTSGTAIESALMGVPTILLDKEGAAMYSSFIHEGIAIDGSHADGAALAETIRTRARAEKR